MSWAVLASWRLCWAASCGCGSENQQSQRQATPRAPVTLFEDVPNTRTALMQAIADLDDAYETGQVEEAVYQERREELKERLMPLLDEDRDASDD